MLIDIFLINLLVFVFSRYLKLLKKIKQDAQEKE
jgi:hypothetical protein